MQSQQQQQQQDAVWSTDIISFKEAAQKIPNLKSSISGIAVNGTGLPIISGAEFAERSANLLSVQNLEEKERDRRIAADSSFSRLEKSASLNATRSMEEAERSRRMKDIDGSEEYRELLAHKVTGSISGDVLTGTSKLRRIALDALGTARQAGQGVLDTASGFAQRAVTFFGQKVASGVASINENLHDFSDKAMEKAQELGGQASGKATELTDRAFDKVQDFTGKAVQQAQSLKEHATTTAQDAGERVVHFGTQKYGDALRLIAIGKLDFAEETERQYRTTIGLSLEKFLLALKTSELIRNYWSEKGQYNAEFSSWYGTGIIEEFERRRRVQHDRSHTSSQDNAKKISQLIHLRNIQTQSYRPQLKQIEKVSEVIGKKAEEIRSVPTRAMAAM